MNKKTPTSILFSLFLFFCLLLSQAAHAHKVNMFAYAEGDTIFMEGYFADGKKAKNSDIIVFNGNGDQLHTGVSNALGEYQFPIPEMTDLRIVLNAGMGHQTEFLIPKNELTDSEEDIDTIEPMTQTVVSTGTSINKQELSQIVDRAVAKAMRPLMRNFAEMREEKSLSGIVGGIGFIFGMMGLYFYFKAKKDFENKA